MVNGSTTSYLETLLLNNSNAFLNISDIFLNVSLIYNKDVFE